MCLTKLSICDIMAVCIDENQQPKERNLSMQRREMLHSMADFDLQINSNGKIMGGVQRSTGKHFDGKEMARIIRERSDMLSSIEASHAGQHIREPKFPKLVVVAQPKAKPVRRKRIPRATTALRKRLIAKTATATA